MPWGETEMGIKDGFSLLIEMERSYLLEGLKAFQRKNVSGGSKNHTVITSWHRILLFVDSPGLSSKINFKKYFYYKSLN